MFQVINTEGRAFNLRIVRLGDRYGRDDCLVHGTEAIDKKLGPMVEFYDASYGVENGFSERGQFVSRYYVSTLRESPNRPHTAGLNLHGGVDGWSIDGRAMEMVHRYLDREVPR